jgi:hypothetical protein
VSAVAPVADVAPLSSDEARTITDQIKVAVEGAWLLIMRAYQARAWAALGYSSWDDYCTREFGTIPPAPPPRGTARGRRVPP